MIKFLVRGVEKMITFSIGGKSRSKKQLKEISESSKRIERHFIRTYAKNDIDRIVKKYPYKDSKLLFRAELEELLNSAKKEYRDGIRKQLETALKNFHGGGNGRRLIISLIEELKNE